MLAAVSSPCALTAGEEYRQPPEPIAQILDAKPEPQVELCPDRSWLLVQERSPLPPISDVAAPELRLAGIRIDPSSFGRSRQRHFKLLRALEIDSGAESAFETPPGGRIEHVSWSHDSTRIALTMQAKGGAELWLGDVDTGRTRQLLDVKLNSIRGAPCAWLPGDAGLVCTILAPGQGVTPKRAATPSGPVIREAEGRAAPNRTYQDLLNGPADEALLEHYLSSRVALVSLVGDVTPIGPPGLHLKVEPSPDGRFLLVETVHRPFSYLVPLRRFPRRIEVWDLKGARVRSLTDLPLQEQVPIGRDAAPTGPREVNWRADAPATLVWPEALDGGDPKQDAKKRDRLLSMEAPFDAEPIRLSELGFRIEKLIWARSDLVLIEERWWRTRRTRTWAVDPSDPKARPRLLFDRSSEERYDDPGDFVTVRSSRGTEVLLTTTEGGAAYLKGDGASPEGDRPFLDRIDLATGEITHLWRSEAPYYEEVVAVLDSVAERFVLRRESVTEPPNYFVRDFGRDGLTRLTSFPDPAPQLMGVAPELIRYPRADGVELSAKLYLPPGYDAAQGPLPFLVWAYPREYKTAQAASQVTGSPHRFVRPTWRSWHLLLLTQGYGILDGPSMPVVGEEDQEPNDTYVEQLVSSAQAAVDRLVELGVADPDRIAIGGHSYGAFMAANLLAHSDLFRAGIARSGAYNRTLTPFGFQAEERTFWQARELYLRMSPFTYADQINEPILLIHGMADNNSGTFPMQSERLFGAIKGNGGTARLAMLPAESHGYRARESVGHMLWEMTGWLDRYVKEGPAEH